MTTVTILERLRRLADSRRFVATFVLAVLALLYILPFPI